MKTTVTSRKVPHSIVSTLYGVGTDMVFAWCFETDENSKLVKRWIPKSWCYVRDNTQDIPDYAFRSEDMRKFHVDVWNAKCYNWERTGKWMTNYELNRRAEKQEEDAAAAAILMSFFY